MSNTNKNPINLAILALALILLLSTFTYAKPFTDAFTGGLIQINDFFTKEQYKPYSTTIDFFFFALLFISVYMIGVRYAFKEVKKPEKVIAILLGLMTAFLLVLGGFSATILLPYIHWLLYTLLFIFYWWLLKGIKSKFWRFILALLLTLLTIGLVQGLFGAFAPDTEGFFSSLGKSFGSIKFPEIGVPGVPDYVTDLFGTSTAAPTGPDLTTLPSATTPTAPESKGFSWWWLALIPLIGAGIWRRNDIANLFRRGEGRQPPTIQINEIIRKKETAINKIKDAHIKKLELLKDATRLEAYTKSLVEDDLANLWTEGGRNKLRQEKTDFRDILEEEFKLIDGLKELREVEKNLFNSLDNWKDAVAFDTTEYVNFFKLLISNKAQSINVRDLNNIIHNLNNIGIIYLIELCYDFEKKEIILDKEITALLGEDNIQSLINDKFKKVIGDEEKFKSYMWAESFVIQALILKINRQVDKLREIAAKISETTQPRPPAPQQPGVPTAAAQPEVAPALPPAQQSTVKINSPAPNSEHIIGNSITNLEAEAEGPQSDLINAGTVPNISFRWYVEQKIGAPEAYPTQQIHIGRTGNSEHISFDTFIQGEATFYVYLFDGERQLTSAQIPIKLIKLPRMRINLADAARRERALQPAQAPFIPPMRINLADVVRRERTLLEKISYSFGILKPRISSKMRKEVERAAHDAKIISEALVEFGKDIVNLPLLQEKSRIINRKVRAIIRLIRIKIKGTRYMAAAAGLEQLEEERMRALGEAAEGPVAEEGPGEGISSPPLSGAPLPIDAAAMEKFGMLISYIKTQNIQAYSTLEDIKDFLGLEQYTLLRFVISSTGSRKMLNQHRETVLTRLEQEKVRYQGQFFGQFIERLIDDIRNM